MGLASACKSSHLDSAKEWATCMRILLFQASLDRGLLSAVEKKSTRAITEWKEAGTRITPEVQSLLNEYVEDGLVKEDYKEAQKYSNTICDLQKIISG